MSDDLPPVSKVNLFEQISMGKQHSCAIRQGALWCWGDNSQGQLGDGTSIWRSTPVQVIGLTSGVTHVAAGYSHTCAIHEGALKCWGINGAGQLGDGYDTKLPLSVVFP
jgi:alpha-tubulin suppressor-like RCC1 family protein